METLAVHGWFWREAEFAHGGDCGALQVMVGAEAKPSRRVVNAPGHEGESEVAA